MRFLPLFLVACAAEAPPHASEDSGCTFDAATMPTLGERGRVGFGYFPAASEALDRPIAAGGAHANVLAFSSVEVGMIDDVRSSAPSVASFTLSAVAQSSCQHQYLVTAHSGQAGTAELILVDASGAEIDRVGVTVAPTESLLYDRGWREAVPSVLAGSLQGLHVTTVGQRGVLVGTGAVRFSFSGSLSRVDGDGEPPWWGGDEVTFAGTPGRGAVIADADRAHLEVPVEIVDEAALTRFELSATAESEPLTRDVFVTAAAGATPVWGAECQWRWPQKRQPLWIDGGWIGAGAVTQYRFTVAEAGTWTAACVLPGGSSRSIDLRFEGAGSRLR
jgi:hypothetical protein